MVNIKRSNNLKSASNTVNEPPSKTQRLQKKTSKNRFSEYGARSSTPLAKNNDPNAGYVYYENEPYNYYYSPVYTPLYVTPASSPLFSPTSTHSPYYAPQELINTLNDLPNDSLESLLKKNIINDLMYDQLGSRTIQTFLTTATKEDAVKVFNTIKPNLIKISTNIFANYIVQKLLSINHDLSKEMLVILAGHFCTLSRDTCGCRVVQCLISTEEQVEEKSRSIKGDQRRTDYKNEAKLVEKTVGSFKQADNYTSFHKFNDISIFCFSGQKISPELTSKQSVENSNRATAIYDELRDNIIPIIKNINGNHVIQRLVNTQNSLIIADILEKIENHFDIVLNDIYGCRVLQKLIEKGAYVIVSLIGLLRRKTKVELNEKKVLVVVKSINKSADILFSIVSKNIKGCIENQHSNYVIQASVKYISLTNNLIEEWLPEEPTKNANILLVGLTHVIKHGFVKLATHKYASNVVEACLCYLPSVHRKKITAMFENTRVLEILVKDPYGNYVIQTGINNCEVETQKRTICRKLRENIARKCNNHHEKHILEFIDKIN